MGWKACVKEMLSLALWKGRIWHWEKRLWTRDYGVSRTGVAACGDMQDNSFPPVPLVLIVVGSCAGAPWMHWSGGQARPTERINDHAWKGRAHWPQSENCSDTSPSWGLQMSMLTKNIAPVTPLTKVTLYLNFWAWQFVLGHLNLFTNLYLSRTCQRCFNNTA